MRHLTIISLLSLCALIGCDSEETGPCKGARALSGPAMLDIKDTPTT